MRTEPERESEEEEREREMGLHGRRGAKSNGDAQLTPAEESQERTGGTSSAVLDWPAPLGLATAGGQDAGRQAAGGERRAARRAVGPGFRELGACLGRAALRRLATKSWI